MIFRLFLLLAVVCTTSCYSGQKSTDYLNASMEDSLFLDKSPVCILGYDRYLYHLAYFKGNEVAALENTPDSGLIFQRYPNLNDRRLHSMNPVLLDSAVVGVTYDQALLYCQWRAENNRRTVTEKSKYRKLYLVQYGLPSPEDFKMAERLAASRKDKSHWKQLFEGPPELTNVPGYVWVKSKEGGRLVPATEVPAHEICFRCKAELLPWTGSSAFY